MRLHRLTIAIVSEAILCGCGDPHRGDHGDETIGATRTPEALDELAKAVPTHGSNESLSQAMGQRLHLRRRRSMVAGRMVAMLATLAAILCACSGRAPSSDDPAPIEECTLYEQALDACIHRDTHFSAQPALVATSDAARERIRSMCTENLRRLRDACR